MFTTFIALVFSATTGLRCELNIDDRQREHPLAWTHPQRFPLLFEQSGVGDTMSTLEAVMVGVVFKVGTFRETYGEEVVCL